MRIFLLGMLLVMANANAATKPCARNRVILITDSHGLTPFGEYLEDWLLTQPDFEVNTYALGGSGPSWWFQSTTSPRGFVFNSCNPKSRLKRSTLAAKAVPAPGLAATLQSNASAYERQIVIVEFGTNVRGATSTYDFETERFVKTIRENPNTSCVWIAPPNMKQRPKVYMDEIFKAIQTGIAKAGGTTADPACQLIDSRKYANYPARTGDGIHYPYTPEGIAAARLWVDGVVTELQPVFSPK